MFSINLEIIEFDCFNQELGVSLNNLPNLKTLKFVLNFNVSYLKDLSKSFIVLFNKFSFLYFFVVFPYRIV